MLTQTTRGRPHNGSAGSKTRRRWAQTLTTIAFVGWLFGCGLLATARWNWIGELVTHFQPFLGGVGIVLTTALALCRRRRAATLALLIAVLLLAPMFRFLPLGDRPDVRAPKIRVATLNLHRDRPDHLDFSDWYKRYLPDVIAFQEVSEPTARHLIEILGDQGTLSLLPRDFEDWTPGIYGQAFFSRLPVLATERVHDGWLGGGIFHVLLDLDGRDLHFVCGQPIRPGFAGFTAGRDQALAKMAALAATQPNSVLLGDLNTTSFSPVFQDLLDRGDLHDSRVGIGWQPSFSPLDRLPIFFPLLAIDHVLLGPDLITIDRQVTETIGSDHWPVIADLAFSTP